jgi:predicted O-linked N-acetylglucosamine transferase (SPINDLY family)
VWRQTTSLSDEAMDAQIRADGVDILIDLSGHTVGNRMLVFARKPAPIQVSGWGHGGGTGLPTVDYLFADPVAIPAAVRPYFAEEIYDLPCHIAFEAPSYTPPVVDLPALSRGSLTFGCLNRYPKVTPAVERLWARILLAVPSSRLLLKSGMFDDPKGRRKVLETFARLGIEEARLELRGSTSRRDHLAAFGHADITLDPFPQNGGISTLESLWMGAPVVAKLGNALGSRASGAILHALGLQDWVAQDDEEYLAVAVRKAADIRALARFRTDIRSRIMASPAGNPDLYTLAVESAYRTMWRRWLEKTLPSASGLSS